MLRPLSFAIALLLAAPAGAATFHVDSEADEVDLLQGDGACATASGHCTLRAAVQEANALPGPDTIRVSAGTYRLTHFGADEDDAAAGDLDLHGSVRVLGAGTDATIVDGNASDRVFDVVGTARVVIARLTVRDGASSSGFGGGGIRIGGSARATLKRLTVSENTAIVGGGISSAGRLKLIASTVRDNSAGFGGGLEISTDAVIRASTFDGNFAGGNGVFGGDDVFATGPAQVTIVNSTSTGEIQTLSLCPNDGGCIEGADILLANVTANAVSHRVLGPDTGSITLRNSIIEKCDWTLISQGYNFIAQEGCFIAGSLNGVVIGDDPSLGSLADHGGPTATRVPFASAAIDGGSPLAPGSGGTACEATDQRGVLRPVGDGCDMGAVEAR